MAKTKDDYFNEGIADAKFGRDRKMLDGTGWRGIAYNAGYDSQRPPVQNPDGSISRIVVDPHTYEVGTLTTNCPKPKTPVLHDPSAPVPIPGYAHVANACSAMARIEHVRLLEQAAATEQNPARKERLLYKSRVVYARWRNGREPKDIAA